MRWIYGWAPASRTHPHPDLRSLLLLYTRGRGTVSCLECAVSLDLPPHLHKLARSQDVIGWDNYMMGMLSMQMAAVQSVYILQHYLALPVSKWLSGLITQLLQVTHCQWIYRCVLVHDQATGTLISAHKEELLKEIEHQLVLGDKGLMEEDRFLLECNFDELTMTNGEQQEYWILAIQAAREACRLRARHGRGSATAQDPTAPRGPWQGRTIIECIYNQMHMLSTILYGLNNSQGYDILEGESPLSAVPTATLLCTHANGV